MRKTESRMPFGKSVATFLLVVVLAYCAHGQSGDTSKTTVQILNSEYSEYIQTKNSVVQKLVHNVKLLHKSDTLYCDSAFFYQAENGFEAFGDVAIYQSDGTRAFADYMRYTGNNKLVYMRSGDEVLLSDNEGNNLWSKEINYNLSTKIGSYRNGGTLQNESTIVTSKVGTYNVRTKIARFQGNVTVDDPEYNTRSTDLEYNTEHKIVRFLGPSVIVNDKSILRTSSGVYDTKQKVGNFVNRSSILNEAQYIEADTLDYDRNSGIGFAVGNVIAIDTTQHSTLYSGFARYSEITGALIAYQQPVMKVINESDSLFIKADTFYSEPILPKDSLTAQDSLQMTSDLLHRSIDTSKNSDSLIAEASAWDRVTEEIPAVDSFPQSADTADKIGQVKRKMDRLVEASGSSLSDSTADTIVPPIRPTIVLRDSVSRFDRRVEQHGDTSKPRYFLAYHNVRIFSDSLQGRCDSLKYGQDDSLMRMFKDPILWQEKSQITGDVILLQFANDDLKELIVPTNGIMISASGPEKAEMFDQIQGNVINAYFKENKLDSVIATPNAKSVYYVTDEDDAYLGVSEASSTKLEIVFEEGRIKRIYYRGDVDQTMTPMQEAQPKELRLSRFVWRPDERPATLEDFLEGVVLPEKPEMDYSF